MEVKYCAVDESGKKRVGHFSGVSVENIVQDLERRGWTVLKCQPSSIFRSKWELLTRRNNKEFVLEFSRQLSVLLNSGVSLIQAINITIGDTEQPQDKQLLMQVHTDIQNGIPLSKSLSQFSHLFSNHYIEVVELGEQTGGLAEAFERNLNFLIAKQKLVSQIKHASTYPFIVLTVAMIVISVLMLKVIPGFQSLFDNFDQQLPWATRQLISTSNFFIDYFYHGLALLIVMPTVIFLFASIKRTKKYFDRWLWRLPFVSKVYSMSFITSFSLTAHTMLDAGIPLNQTLVKLIKGTSNVFCKTQLQRVLQSVLKGESFYRALKQSGLFPSMFLQLIKVGEETGKLDSTLKTLSSIYQTRLEAHIKQIISLIEPAIVVLLGVIIGGLVLVMYLPIFEMSTFL